MTAAAPKPGRFSSRSFHELEKIVRSSGVADALGGNLDANATTSR